MGEMGAQSGEDQSGRHFRAEESHIDANSHQPLGPAFEAHHDAGPLVIDEGQFNDRSIFLMSLGIGLEGQAQVIGRLMGGGHGLIEAGHFRRVELAQPIDFLPG